MSIAMTDLLTTDELPQWFSYPPDFLEIFGSGIQDIEPWELLTGQWLRVRVEGLRQRFPNRELVPFARRLDSDDVACWDRSRPGAVFVVHDFAAPGWEAREVFDSFRAWRECVRAQAHEQRH
jgi:hypothetical protein